MVPTQKANSNNLGIVFFFFFFFFFFVFFLFFFFFFFDFLHNICMLSVHIRIASTRRF